MVRKSRYEQGSPMMSLEAGPTRRQTPTTLLDDAATIPSLDGAALTEQSPLCRALRYCGLMAWQAGQLDDAVTNLSKAAMIAPDHPMLLAELASVLFATGKKSPRARP